MESGEIALLGSWPEVDRFADLMRRELDANAHKGGWSEMTPEALVNEVWWHTAKLALAVREGDQLGVAEFAADVANLAMMTYEQAVVSDSTEEASDDR